MNLHFKANELYRELEIFDGDTKIGEAEIELKGHMLSRLVIYEPYQNSGYGTEIVKVLTDNYKLTNLWVNADNERAIHVYSKCGYHLRDAKMYEMTTEPEDREQHETS